LLHVMTAMGAVGTVASIRLFGCIYVLAWHMSYSHHDLALKSAYGNLYTLTELYLCRFQGKTIHLNSKHKELSLSHNEQCLYQRQPVISPLAPAAMRMMQVADDEYVTAFSMHPVPLKELNDP
uniref:Pecanex-like protein n=1 Tax=Heligmosomoides polygyrus TaxID=6339 RepID=A0A183FJW0_HELPZ